MRFRLFFLLTFISIEFVTAVIVAKSLVTPPGYLLVAMFTSKFLHIN